MNEVASLINHARAYGMEQAKYLEAAATRISSLSSLSREEIIEKASRAYWDGPRRDGSKATVPWDDKYLNELWKARVRDQIEAALIAIGVIK